MAYVGILYIYFGKFCVWFFKFFSSILRINYYTRIIFGMLLKPVVILISIICDETVNIVRWEMLNSFWDLPYVVLNNEHWLNIEPL